MTISNIRMRGDTVEFSADGEAYLYIVTRAGRLYIGGCDWPVHQSDMGSFEISENRSLPEIKANAHILGAQVRRA